MKYFSLLVLTCVAPAVSAAPVPGLPPNQPFRVGMLLRTDSALGQTLLGQPGQSAVTLKDMATADFFARNLRLFTDLSGSQITTSVSGRQLEEVAYFSVSLPQGTQLSNFRIVQEYPGLTNSRTRQYGAYAEVVADTNITDPSVRQALERQHAAREAKTRRHAQRQQVAKKHMEKQHAAKVAAHRHELAKHTVTKPQPAHHELVPHELARSVRRTVNAKPFVGPPNLPAVKPVSTSAAAAKKK